MTLNEASFETLIATVENKASNAKSSLKEIIQLLQERLESDINLLNDVTLDKFNLYRSLSESLGISGPWLFRIAKNKSLVSAWEGEWIDFINSLEMLYLNQYIPLYNKTLGIWQFLSTEKMTTLEDYNSVSASTGEIHKLYSEVYLAIAALRSEMP